MKVLAKGNNVVFYLLPLKKLQNFLQFSNSEKHFFRISLIFQQAFCGFRVGFYSTKRNGF